MQKSSFFGKIIGRVNKDRVLRQRKHHGFRGTAITFFANFSFVDDGIYILMADRESILMEHGLIFWFFSFIFVHLYFRLSIHAMEPYFCI